MADHSVVSEIVTKFFLNTCRLHPQLSEHGIQAAMMCALTARRHPADNAEIDFISLVTGSAAEFYIEPMLPYAGDIDVMFHDSRELAIPRGHPPPTKLPAKFHDYVTLYEIVDSHLPGYVYLKLRYLLSESIEDDMYYCVENDEELYLSNMFFYNRDYHGPAVVATGVSRGPVKLLSTDEVRCVTCLSWPSQAADWPIRHRNYGWPDSVTVDHVVNNGCDVVGVAHRQCKQHELMGRSQWRLSFSRAEIVLINSWMPVQQIVYHMLRFFLKTKRLTDSADNSERVMSNYHIKTLMLWTSELKPRSWWTEPLNLVRICVELLHILSVCFIDTCCPHYFVNNCNLVDVSLNLGVVATELASVNEAFLSAWLVDKYIGECAQLCPDYVLQLFYDANTITNLQKVTSAIIQCRLNTSLFHLWDAFFCTV